MRLLGLLKLLLWLSIFALSCSQGALALRDPTEPAKVGDVGAASVTSTGGINLTAIMVSPQRRLAVINDQVVREKDVIDGFVVESIQETFVVLKSRSGRLARLPLAENVKTPYEKPEPIKQPVSKGQHQGLKP